MDDQPVIRRRGRPAKQPQESTLNEHVDEAVDIEADAPLESFKRVYAKHQLVDHDLYKLEVAYLQRNISYNVDDPMYENVEHTHFFHSVDSNGSPQDYSTKIGGHFHKVTVVDGKAVCGPAMMEVRKKKGGRIVKMVEPVTFDHHTHKCNYKFSEKLKPKAINAEFAKVQSTVANFEGQFQGALPRDVVDNG